MLAGRFAGSTLQVLLVDDDDVDVENVRRAFAETELPIEIIVARDGQQALELLTAGAVTIENCVVLLDLNMPRMNGIEFLRALRENHEYDHLPVMVLTTSDAEPDRVSAHDLNVAGYMLKPITFDDFITTLDATMIATPNSPEPVRLILIDDDAVDRAAVTRALAQATGKYHVEEFDSGEAGLARVRSAPADCVLLDYSLPGADGFEILAQLQADDLDVPVIMLTGIGDEELVIESLRRGAYDYLSKAKLDADTLESKIRVVRRLHDASLRTRAAEAELRESVNQLRRAVVARDNVLAVVSHDLRGPLNNIELAMGLLEENVSPQQRALAIASVHRAITRADRLISDLLDVARLSGGAIELVVEPVDPAIVVETAVSDVQPALQQQNLRVAVEIADDMAPILADRNRVIQILDNLLRNAIKYGPRGGEVGVQARRRGAAVEFSVRDQGPGLDIETQAHVFDWFWRAKDRKTASGSGLGLAIAQGLVKSHGGEIGVESSPGRGARFWFTIPLAQ